MVKKYFLWFLLLVFCVFGSAQAQKLDKTKWRILAITDSAGTDIPIPEELCFTMDLLGANNKKRLTGYSVIEDCKKAKIGRMYHVESILFEVDYLQKKIEFRWIGADHGKTETYLDVRDKQFFIHFSNIFSSYGVYRLEGDKLVLELRTIKSKYKSQYYKLIFQQIER